MILVALAIVVLPLFKKQALQSADGAQRNLKIARQHLQDLKQQLQDGLLTQNQYDEQNLELQQSLNDDLEIEAEAENRPGNGRWIVPLLILFLPLLSIALYLHLGDTDALKKAEVQQHNQDKMAEVKGMINKIIERLKQNPDDYEAWLMLGRSYIFLQQYQQAADVFAKLYQLQPDNIEVILNYADTLGMTHNGQLAGEPAKLIYKALQLAPDNNDALWLAGLAKVEEGDAGQAMAHWQKLAAQLPADSPALPQVKQMMAELSAQTVPQPAGNTAPGVNIQVQVELDAAVKPQVQAEQIVFIYAQALNGPKMPLAIQRKRAGDLPLKVDLNDSMAMQPNMHLSDFKQLKIVARISKTGNASTQAGDFIGATELTLPAGDQPVSILINQEVK